MQHRVRHRVQLNASTCVPTCLGMMMDYFGKYVDQMEIDQVAFRMGNGIYGHHRGTLATAKYFGFEAAGYAYHKTDNLSCTLISLVMTQPILVTGKFHHFPENESGSGHAVLVIGYDGTSETVSYHDPHHQKAATNSGVGISMSIDLFIRKWAVEHMGWGLWLNKDLLSKST